jgi:hypothetical protein
MPPAEAPPQSLSAADAWPDPGPATAVTTPPVAAAASTAAAQTNRRRGGTSAHHRPFAPVAQAPRFVTDRTRRRSTVVTETLAVALPQKAASAGLDFEELYRSRREQALV